MPDRLPPSWGLEPEDGRDLDGVLSVEEILTDEALIAGQLAGISDAQRPVAGAMFALRSAPAESELAGEAAARAAFRALMAPPGTVAAGAVPAGTDLVAPVAPGHGADLSRGDSVGAQAQRTVILPLQAAGQGSRPPARHRHRRRAVGSRGGWRAMTLAGSAAAVVAIGAVALTGAFAGSAGPGGQSAGHGVAQTSPGAGVSPSGTQHVLGGGQQASKDAMPSASPTASAVPGTNPRQGASQSSADLCNQLIGLWFQHPPRDRAQIWHLIEELAQRAGSPEKIAGYCAQQLSPAAAARSLPTSWPGYPYYGSGEHHGRADSGAGADQGGPGQANSGPGGGVSGSASSGSGSR